MNDLLPIESDRLIIKKTTTDDIDLILKIDKQEETQKYLGGVKNKTKEERIDFLKRKDSLIHILFDKLKINIVYADCIKENNR